MTSIIQVQQVLAEVPTERLAAFQIAARAGITADDFYRLANRWLKRGHLSRVKVKGRGWCYFLNDQQLRIYMVKKALGPGVKCWIPASAYADDINKFEALGLMMPAEDVPDRLKFLRMLKEKTVFGEHAMLALIISDYERTIKLRADEEDRIDQQSTRERRNTAPMRSSIQPSRGPNT